MSRQTYSIFRSNLITAPLHLIVVPFLLQKQSTLPAVCHQTPFFFLIFTLIMFPLIPVLLRILPLTSARRESWNRFSINDGRSQPCDYPCFLFFPAHPWPHTCLISLAPDQAIFFIQRDKVRDRGRWEDTKVAELPPVPWHSHVVRELGPGAGTWQGRWLTPWVSFPVLLV